jgi:CRISPR system Cascade subunit CasC
MNTHRFLQIHLLTAYGPANLNRDDLGQPKTAVLGNVQRLRISSQSLKRAWRTSETFVEELGGQHLGQRTKRIGKRAEDIMKEHGLDAKRAFEWSKLIAQSFGKLSKDDDSAKKSVESNAVETLVFVSANELAAVDALARELATQKVPPTDEQLKLLRKVNASADLALFGRMLTADKDRKAETSDRPQYNVEAAAQVAHAVTVHQAAVEDDYFSAVDDLNPSEDTGSGHLGETGFGAGVFYLYACIDRNLLIENLGGDRGLAARTLKAFVKCMASVAPTGKQNAFASRAYASFGLAELSDAQPRQLIAAFLRPVAERDGDVLAESVTRIHGLLTRLDSVYGFDGARAAFNATEAQVDFPATTGSNLRDFCTFAARGLE